MANSFLKRHFFKQNASKKQILNSNCIGLYLKLLSQIMNLGKCPNQKTHESESEGFLVLAFPEVMN